MNVLSKGDLTPLLEARAGWHISIFMQRSRGVSKPNETRFAQDPATPGRGTARCPWASRARGARTRTPVQQLLTDSDRLRLLATSEPRTGALFGAPTFLAYRVPLPLDELVMVTPRFTSNPCCLCSAETATFCPSPEPERSEVTAGHTFQYQSG